MKCVWYDEIQTFIRETWEILLVSEVQNNLLMGNAIRERDGGRANDLRVSVKDEEGKIRLIGIMTRPFNMVLYEVDNIPCPEATEVLIADIINLHIEFPGVIGEVELVHRFRDKYIEVTHQACEVKLSMNLMKLTHVIKPGLVAGKGRLATEEDLFYLPYWQVAFAEECGIEVPTLEESMTSIRGKINRQEIYIWEDPYPVTVVASTRGLEKGMGIGFVYTPPMYRGNGYASNCVANMSSRLLDKGYEYCYLYADQKNPISNSIYKKIGYEPICVSESLSFK